MTEVYGPNEWRPLAQAPLPDLPMLPSNPCAAIKENGDPCKLKATNGSVFCRVHGGNTQLAQDQTRRRLDLIRAELFDKLVEAADEAVDTYISIMRNGKKDADRLKASDRVLELLGVRDQVIQVDVKHTVEHSDIEMELVGLLKGMTTEKLSGVIETTASEEEDEHEFNDVA